jgi:SHS2 domain-containing protein
MYKTEILPHAADVKIKIEADSLEALFQAGLKSMSCLLKEDINEKENDLPVACMVELHAGDTTALLIDFPSEVL